MTHFQHVHSLLSVRTGMKTSEKILHMLSCHLSTGASDCCLCDSTGGAASYAPEDIKTTFPIATRLYPASLMWDVAKLSRGTLGQCVSSAN